MKAEKARRWMKRLNSEAEIDPADADRIWARRLLEEEFSRRRDGTRDLARHWSETLEHATVVAVLLALAVSIV